MCSPSLFQYYQAWLAISNEKWALATINQPIIPENFPFLNSMYNVRWGYLFAHDIIHYCPQTETVTKNATFALNS